MCCAVLCCAVLCCAVLCCTVLYCVVLCCTVLYCAVLCCVVLCCAVCCVDGFAYIMCGLFYCFVRSLTLYYVMPSLFLMINAYLNTSHHIILSILFHNIPLHIL